jgi:hypothetical protein
LIGLKRIFFRNCEVIQFLKKILYGSQNRYFMVPEKDPLQFPKRSFTVPEKDPLQFLKKMLYVS